MTDLAHTYTTDITYTESQVKSADSEFTAQRMGQNTNNLIDQYPITIATLNSLASQISLVYDYNASFAPGNGNSLLATTPNGTNFKGGIAFISGLTVSTMFPFQSTFTCNQSNNTNIGSFRFYVSGSGFYIAVNGSVGYRNIQAKLFYPPV